MPAKNARIPLLTVDEMTDEQRRFHDSVVSGPRGELVGPLRAAIHSPALADLWSRFGEHLRYGTSLPPRISELAIIVTGRRWNAQVEWWVHARKGAEAGLPMAVIDAIERLEGPIFAEQDDFDVYEYARLLQQDGQVPDALYDRVRDRWGTKGVVELTAVIGYYTLVAMTLNAHGIPVPDGSSPLPPADGLVRLAPARRA